MIWQVTRDPSDTCSGLETGKAGSIEVIITKLLVFVRCDTWGHNLKRFPVPEEETETERQVIKLQFLLNLHLFWFGTTD